MSDERARLAPRVDPFAESVRCDPYPDYARFRDAGAVCRGGAGVWVIPRYAEISALLRDRTLGQFHFHRARSLITSTGTGAGPAPPEADPTGLIDNIVAARDRPEHTQLRRLLQGAFTTRLLGQLSYQVADRARAAISQLREAGSGDAVPALAEAIPAQILSELLDLPSETAIQACRHACALTPLFQPFPERTEQDLAAESVHWLRGLIRPVIEARDGRSDVVSALQTASQQRHYSVEELVDNAIFLLFAGFETSVNLIAAGTRLFAADPSALRSLRANPDLAAPAVEEILRIDTPTQLTGRITQRPLTVAGQRIGAGRIVLLLLASGNRDVRRFPDPDSFQMARRRNQHLSFGGGIHYCLGAELARVEGQKFLRALAHSNVSLELVGPVVRRPSATLRQYESVPIGVS